MKSIFIAFAFAAAPLLASAQEHRHQLRIGWGDPMYESIIYRPSTPHAFGNPAAIPQSFRIKENFGNRFTGHIFAEYRFSFSELVSVGAQVDFESISWRTGVFDRNHAMVGEDPGTHFYNTVFLPGVRFTYFRSEWVKLYSGLGAGVLLSVAEKGELAPAFNLNVLGVQAGRGHWSASLELGALNAISGMAKVYLLASRVVSVSVNYSW